MTAQVVPEPNDKPKKAPGQQVLAGSSPTEEKHGKPIIPVTGEKLNTLRGSSPRASSSEKKMRDQGLFGFVDPQSVKEQVKRALEKQEPYSVFQYYKDETESFWPKVAKHPVFENVTLGVITVNAAYIAIDTDWNKAEPLTPTNTNSLMESDAFFQFMEHAFCTYFTFEWIMRFLSFKVKINGLKDGWFIFDSLLVFMMVMETWVLLIYLKASGSTEGSPIGGTSILRLFRLLRLSRLLRMLRSLPELMILIKGMVTAMKSVMYVMGLLVLITYVFAIAFTQLAVGKDIGFTFFANVSHAMYSLLIYATFLDDLSAFTDALREEMPVLLLLTLIFICVACLTVMNMLIGVLCEVVTTVAENERDEIRTEILADSMREIVSEFNEELRISYKEFCEILKKPEGIRALDAVGVNPIGIVDFAELFFFEDDPTKSMELTFERFMEVILELRESNQATVKDMLNLWMKIKMSVNKDITHTKQALDTLTVKTKDCMSSIDDKHSKMEGQVKQIMKDLQRLGK
eukprot:gnl/MRDRNA2_/MRDRNA2_62472_c0_seq1.p1 gnl/MRDRNA2_/MRDRNA2_62472_c0~~gnl/MRDRNA2_/MRDRNA2_62472_c0_seq1.p1  ORF type:complete len:517 (+),score=100.32 gnl/MRDRNA2_/MRDRNA2_62472_c0_seq1:137-1687(+)